MSRSTEHKDKTYVASSGSWNDFRAQGIWLYCCLRHRWSTPETHDMLRRRPRRLQIIGYYSKQRPSASGDVSHIWSRAAPLPTVSWLRTLTWYGLFPGVQLTLIIGHNSSSDSLRVPNLKHGARDTMLQLLFNRNHPIYTSPNCLLLRPLLPPTLVRRWYWWQNHLDGHKLLPELKSQTHPSTLLYSMLLVRWRHRHQSYSTGRTRL